jgi:glycosyltransferase involved in cell wall biosynthesis
LRVCFVSSYPPNRARLSEYAENLVEELAKRPNIETIYVLADKTDSNERLKNNPKIQVIRAWNPDDPFSIAKILFSALKLHPDVLHFNMHFQSFGRNRVVNFSGFSLVLLSRMFGLKTVVLLHNLGEKVDLRKVNLNPSLLNKVGILLATKILLTAQNVVVPVQSYAQYIKTHHKYKNVKYVPHGTNTCNSPKKDCEDKKILLFGHMGPSKGIPVMFEAFKKIAKEQKNVTLIVAGNSHPNYSHFIDSLKKIAPPNTKFLGYIPEENLSSVFNDADVVVLPYLIATGTSGVFHMSCGYGRPVVASDLPEIRELVNDGAAAILVPPGDAEALKNAVLQVLFDKDVAEKISKQNLCFAQKESWSSVAKAYEEVYFELQHTKHP